MNIGSHSEDVRLFAPRFTFLQTLLENVQLFFPLVFVHEEMQDINVQGNRKARKTNVKSMKVKRLSCH